MPPCRRRRFSQRPGHRGGVFVLGSAFPRRRFDQYPESMAACLSLPVATRRHSRSAWRRLTPTSSPNIGHLRTRDGQKPRDHTPLVDELAIFIAAQCQPRSSASSRSSLAALSEGGMTCPSARMSSSGSARSRVGHPPRSGCGYGLRRHRPVRTQLLRHRHCPGGADSRRPRATLRAARGRYLPRGNDAGSVVDQPTRHGLRGIPGTDQGPLPLRCRRASRRGRIRFAWAQRSAESPAGPQSTVSQRRRFRPHRYSSKDSVTLVCCGPDWWVRPWNLGNGGIT